MARGRLAGLTRLDRGRLNATLLRLQRRPWAMALFNLLLLAISATARVRSLALDWLGRLGLSRALFRRRPRVVASASTLGITRALPASPSVLLVVEDSIPQCLRYRVQHKLAQLERLGWPARCLGWRQVAEIRQALALCDIVIFYRVPGFPEVLKLFDLARQLRRVMIYDVDDLVFDRAELAAKFPGPDAQLSAHEHRELLRGADLYRAALARCDYGIASTEALAERMQDVVARGLACVHPNAVDPLLLDRLQRPGDEHGAHVTLFYGSGTRTHDADFASIAPAIAAVMEQEPSVRLVIAGELTLPESLDRARERVHRLPLLDFEAYLDALEHADVSIAPLTPGPFADAKSEIKWLEAAMLGVVSVVSPTRTYEAALTDGEHVVFARDPGEWREALVKLVREPDERERIAAAARRRALERFGPDAMAGNLAAVLEACLAEAGERKLVRPPSRERQRLLLVNTLYPPQSLGGATLVVKGIVDELRTTHGEDFDVAVFCYDLTNVRPYEIRQYDHDGVEVAALSVPASPDLDWEYQDEEAGRMFGDFLRYWQPDLVHFHSIQRLTGSLCEAARAAGVPYCVTVHDAWWLSDHQFLLDDDGEPCGLHQADPVVAAATSEDVRVTLRRQRYLRSRLLEAAAVFAVSGFQAGLYRMNGVPGVQLSRNGVRRPSRGPGERQPRPGRLSLGYLGGICRHKGYHLLREAVEGASLQSCRLTVVDFDHQGAPREERWGGTPVSVVAPFGEAEADAFWSQLDVLVAPSIWPESYGLVTREALLRGVWVVAANVGALAEDVRPGVDGFVFPGGNVEGLVEILRELDANPERYRERVIAGSAGARVPTVAGQVVALRREYERIIAEAGRRTTARGRRAPSPGTGDGDAGIGKGRDTHE